jgi:hypothetical protein
LLPDVAAGFMQPRIVAFARGGGNPDATRGSSGSTAYVAFKVNIMGPLALLGVELLISGLLVAMLGLAGLRTYEKVANTEGNC